jgi:palmitoyl transferase
MKMNCYRSQLIDQVKLFIWLITLSCIWTIPAFAEGSDNEGVWSRFKNSVSQTWASEDYELYIPINTWHNRSFYSSEQINEFNERPWGLGVGKYRFDEDGNWHALYIMAFQDSNNELEPLGGYAFQKIWRPNDDWRLGLGYTVGVTMRHDSHYLPIPLILPLLSVKFKELAVQSTYVPGGEGHGNILFTWLRWEL